MTYRWKTCCYVTSQYQFVPFIRLLVLLFLYSRTHSWWRRVRERSRSFWYSQKWINKEINRYWELKLDVQAWRSSLFLRTWAQKTRVTQRLLDQFIIKKIIIIILIMIHTDRLQEKESGARNGRQERNVTVTVISSVSGWSGSTTTTKKQTKEL